MVRLIHLAGAVLGCLLACLAPEGTAGKKDVPPKVQMELVRVSKDNLGEWARQLQAWGFSDIDPKFLALPK